MHLYSSLKASSNPAAVRMDFAFSSACSERFSRSVSYQLLSLCWLDILSTTASASAMAITSSTSPTLMTMLALPLEICLNRKKKRLISINLLRPFASPFARPQKGKKGSPKKSVCAPAEGAELIWESVRLRARKRKDAF